MYVLDTIFKDFQTLVSSIVIKYESLARQYETIETRRSSDEYLSAAAREDTFRSYVRFEADVLIRAGVATNYVEARPFIEDKNLIPTIKRDRVLEEQRKFIIDNYEEQNNYYRMLSGLPDLGDLSFVFVDLEVAIDLGINPNTPIHQLPTGDINKLLKSGELARIIEAHPDKKYLGFLGDEKIELSRARRAKNFSVLRMTSNISDTFNEEFDNIYDQCREYFMSTIYNKEFGKSYDLYDNFIAMMIMVFTMQRIVSNAFKYGIESDFYDMGSIQMMFNAYNVPFMSKVPMQYQRILVRNLNNLLRYKATDKVLYDICSLLGFERIKIYEYYLIKQHKLDINDKPVFFYKEVDNGDGTTSIVEDREKMFSLFFQSVELNERNKALALANTTNVMDYNQVVIEDPYWWHEDEELKNYIYESEFNFVETKFLSMNIMYKMTEMLFEVIYVFHMLLDKKNDLNVVSIELPQLFTRKQINLFDVTILLCALLAKKNGLRGEIISTPSKTLAILGFNFKEDFDKIKEFLDANKNLIDSDRIWKYIQNLRIFTPQDVNNLYVNIRELNDFLVERLGAAQNIDEYRAYQKLFQALMITTHTEALFKKSDGTIAETFLEYLQDHDEEMANFVMEVDIEMIGDHIEHILARINMLATDLKYLFIINDSNSVLLNAVITLVRFFKSYTTDLTSFNIFYLMDSRYYNMIKTIHDIHTLEANMDLVDDSMLLAYRDSVAASARLPKKDLLNLMNSYEFNALTKTSDKMIIKDASRRLETKYHIHEDVKPAHRPRFKKEIDLREKRLVLRKEKVSRATTLHSKEDNTLHHRVKSTSSELLARHILGIAYSDSSHTLASVQRRDGLLMADSIRIIREN